VTDAREGLQWYVVRCVLRHLDEVPGSDDNWYEERLTLWQARTDGEAIQLAEAEAEEYVDDLDDEYLGLAQSYRLPTEPVHGAEVFSLIRRSSLTPQAYLGAFFATGTEVTGLLGEP
jgi:hypothetical protein